MSIVGVILIAVVATTMVFTGFHQIKVFTCFDHLLRDWREQDPEGWRDAGEPCGMFSRGPAGAAAGFFRRYLAR